MAEPGNRTYEDSQLRDKKRLAATLEEVKQKGMDVILGTPDEVAAILQIDDTVFPICTQGINRSQIVYARLVELNKENNGSLEIMLPHGAGNGNDPFTGNSAATMEQAFGYIRDDFDADTSLDNPPWNRAFTAAMKGEKKQPRFGDAYIRDQTLQSGRRVVDAINDMENLSDLNEARGIMHEYFNANYWKHKPKYGGRRIYVCFNRAVHITLQRLLENEVDLQGAVLYGIDMSDKLTEANGDYEAAYVQMSTALYQTFQMPRNDPLP